MSQETTSLRGARHTKLHEAQPFILQTISSLLTMSSHKAANVRAKIAGHLDGTLKLTQLTGKLLLS